MLRNLLGRPLMRGMSTLGRAAGGKVGIIWLLNDQFTTNASAPLTSGAAAEPGPGVRTIVDTGNQLTIASQKLTITGIAGTAYVNPRVVYPAQNRAAGLALFLDLTQPIGAGYPLVGFFRVSTGGELNCAAVVAMGSSNYYMDRDALALVVGAITMGTTYSVCICLQATGAFYFAKGGSQYTSWTLLFFDPADSTSALYPTITHHNTTGTKTFDNVRVRQLPSPFTSTNSLATLTQASPASATSYTGDADGIQLVTFVPPVTLVDSNELRFRYQDASNYWTAYFDSAGAFKVDSVVAGTPTNRINVAGVSTGNNARTIAISSYGTSHDFFTLAGSTWTKRGSTITVSTPMDSATTVRLVIGVGSVASNLQSYPRTKAAWSSELDKG